MSNFNEANEIMHISKAKYMMRTQEKHDNPGAGSGKPGAGPAAPPPPSHRHMLVASPDNDSVARVGARLWCAICWGRSVCRCRASCWRRGVGIRRSSGGAAIGRRGGGSSAIGRHRRPRLHIVHDRSSCCGWRRVKRGCGRCASMGRIAGVSRLQGRWRKDLHYEGLRGSRTQPWKVAVADHVE